MNREKVIKESEEAIDILAKAEEPTFWMDFVRCAFENALAMLKEQEAEIRQLRLVLDIAKGTCKGIKSGGGKFADAPTMQSAT